MKTYATANIRISLSSMYDVCLTDMHDRMPFIYSTNLTIFNSLNATDFQITELLCTLDFGYKKVEGL